MVYKRRGGILPFKGKNKKMSNEKQKIKLKSPIDQLRLDILGKLRRELKPFIGRDINDLSLHKIRKRTIKVLNKYFSDKVLIAEMVNQIIAQLKGGKGGKIETSNNG